MGHPVERPTYRLQIVEIPPDKGHWFFGSGQSAMLCNIRVDLADVLPLIESSVKLLQTAGVSPEGR